MVTCSEKGADKPQAVHDSWLFREMLCKSAEDGDVCIIPAGSEGAEGGECADEGEPVLSYGVLSELELGRANFALKI